MTPEQLNAALCAGQPHFTDQPIERQRPVCMACPVRDACLSIGLDQAREAPSAYGLIPYAGLDATQLWARRGRRKRLRETCRKGGHDLTAPGARAESGRCIQCRAEWDRQNRTRKAAA